MLIIGLDVGSVRRPGGFAWATADETGHGQDDPSALGEVIVEALNIGRRVALAVECPLAVPVPEPSLVDWIHLGRARSGEGNRSWSAGAGTGALATGLVQLAWLCSFIQTRSQHAVRATTQLGKFLTEDIELFLCEAMVTSDGKPEAVTELQDHLDAVAAAKRLAEILNNPTGTQERPDVCCAPMRSLNLAAAAVLHAGTVIDPQELCQDVLVAKVRPVVKP